MNRVASFSFAMMCIVGLLVLGAGSAMGRPVVQSPFVRVISPAPEQCVPGPNVEVRFEAGGICFSPCANNVHFMLDDQPFEAQYDLSHPHVFHDVQPGTHTLRVYLANHLHEAIAGTVDVITFSVAYPDEDNRIEFGEPLLTYNLPQGEYLGIDAADITVNWLVDGVNLSRRGYRVQYYVDGRRYIVYDCMTRHIKGLAPGPHTFKVELVDERGRVAPGPFNSVERVVLLSPDKSTKTFSPDEDNRDLPKIPSIHGAMTVGWPSVAVDEFPAVPAVRRDITVKHTTGARTDAAQAEEKSDAIQDLDSGEEADPDAIPTTRVPLNEQDILNDFGMEETTEDTTGAMRLAPRPATVPRNVTTLKALTTTTGTSITRSAPVTANRVTTSSSLGKSVPIATFPKTSSQPVASESATVPRRTAVSSAPSVASAAPSYSQSFGVVGSATTATTTTHSPAVSAASSTGQTTLASSESSPVVAAATTNSPAIRSSGLALNAPSSRSKASRAGARLMELIEKSQSGSSGSEIFERKKKD